MEDEFEEEQITESTIDDLINDWVSGTKWWIIKIPPFKYHAP